jgi:hypothetical protein
VETQADTRALAVSATTVAIADEAATPTEREPHVVAVGRTVLDPLRRLWWIHLPIIAAMTTVSLAISQARLPDISGSFHLHHLVYLLPVPYVVLAIAGLLTPAGVLPGATARRLDRLIICLVTKGTNPDVVRRTYRSLLPLCGPRVELCVVTDHALDIPHLLVPADFRTRHARYKARALEYFRQQQRFGPGGWVLHLDEESVLDAHGLRACLDYCERSPFLYGQGAIFYNNHEFWRHPVLTAADCIRAADDVAKFHLQLARLHRPIFGLHGSFLLAKGSLEDEITWDLPGSLVEDYAFAVECMGRGYGVGEVHGILREQSPKGIMDFLRQRRRWLVGIRGLSALSPWARLWSVLWSASPLVKAATVADVLFARNLPFAMVVAGNLFASTFLYLYLLGSVLQDLDRGTPAPRLLLHACLTGLLFPVSYALEGLAVLWSFISRERRIGFQTIEK